MSIRKSGVRRIIGEGVLSLGISIRMRGTISPGGIGSDNGIDISRAFAPSSEASRDEIWFPVVSAFSSPVRGDSDARALELNAVGWANFGSSATEVVSRNGFLAPIIFNRAGRTKSSNETIDKTGLPGRPNIIRSPAVAKVSGLPGFDEDAPEVDVSRFAE